MDGPWILENGVQVHFGFEHEAIEDGAGTYPSNDVKNATKKIATMMPKLVVIGSRNRSRSTPIVGTSRRRAHVWLSQGPGDDKCELGALARGWA